MIQTRATRAITKAIMAAGTAGTIASVYWLVSRIVDDNDYKRLNDSPKLTNAEITVNSDGYNEDYSEEEDSECYHCNRFRDLPVIFESDNEYTEDITGYTGDCYTPSNDICMLSVSIKTLDDSHLDVSSRECRLCEAAESKFAINYEDINAQNCISQRPNAPTMKAKDLLSEYSCTMRFSSSNATSQLYMFCCFYSSHLRKSHLNRGTITKAFLPHITMFTPRVIAQKFVTHEQNEGVGARVHRSIGTTRLRNLDPFLMLDEFYVGLPGGFPDHPHRGFETVTYVLPTSQGHMCHEDFLGNKGELRPGDLQWMTPGRGIMHAEMPKSEVPAHGLQLWINLPSKERMVEPKYQEISREMVPHAFNEDKSIEAIVFAGEAFGQRGPIDTVAPVSYVHFMLQKGATWNIEFQKCANHSIQPHEAIVLEMKGDGVMLQAEDRLEVIVMTGQPLEEPVVQYGPFVMSSKDEIQQTWEDFQSAKNGFENAHTWASEIGNRRI
ncbi:putative rmlC-like cupin domain superfamily, pirin, rmlC-like jelly roll [Plasmopara halstedii]